MFSLAGKRALVTGASRGIGRGIALALAKAGADLILNDAKPEPELESIVTETRELGVESFAGPADVSSEDSVMALLAQVESTMGGLDILISNAGTSRAEEFSDISVASWHEVMDNNVTSSFLCARGSLDIMKKNSAGGRMILISSIVAHQGALFGHAHYAASKSAQLGLTKTLARVAAEHRITVNAIAPGVIATELSARTHGDDAIADFSTTIPLGIGTVDDVAAAALFLASDEARYITGITLDVNGGQYIR